MRILALLVCVCVLAGCRSSGVFVSVRNGGTVNITGAVTTAQDATKAVDVAPNTSIPASLVP